MGAAPFVESFARNLEQGEGVQAFADAIVRQGEDGIATGKVILTDRRVLLVMPDEHEEQDVRAFGRSDCSVVNARDRDDGSLLVVIRTGDTMLGLCFMDWWRQEGMRLIDALRHDEVRGRQRVS